MEEKSGKSRRGFASMTPEKRKQVASQGGKAAHAKGTAHRYTSEEASIAGRKGGLKLAENREYMSKLGRKGGLARAYHACPHEWECKKLCGGPSEPDEFVTVCKVCGAEKIPDDCA